MKPRLFFALETPPAVREEIAALIRRLRRREADVRWEPPTRSHCTLRFLGETDESLLPGIIAAATPLLQASLPVHVRYANVGAFPHLRDPRVFWVGVEETTGTLRRLREDLDGTLAGLGIPREEKPFHPHVTLGRVRSRRGIDDLITEVKSTTFESPPATLRELLLIRSELRPSGSVYSTLHAFPFGQSEMR
jgi:2'-5' RNA ligase